MSNGPCCESPLVTGGAYARGFDVSIDGMYGDPSYTATVSEFRLDKYEATVGRFRQFVDTGQGTRANPPMPGAGTHPRIAGSGWDATWNINLVADTPALLAAHKCDATYQTWTDTPGANENRPMVCIDWYEAMAFCAWDGGFLPTEAEWNYAAAGGSEQRAYPWSNPPSSISIDSTRASYHDGTTCVGDGMPGCALTDLVAVGTKPAGDGRWGQSDLAGNVWEWTLDWYASPYPQTPCIDCANLTPGTVQACRGGSFSRDVTLLRAAARYPGGGSPGRYNDLGVRCARTP